jgi:predicted PurR-regulated permease PerM
MRKTERAYPILINLAALILAVVALHFGRPLLMPLAIASLFSFLFSPIVDALCRWKFRRPLAVGVVVVLMFSVFGGIVYGIGKQVTMLANELPKYKDNIRQKIVDLRSASKGSPIHKVQQAIRELRGELKRREVQERQTNASPSIGEPTPIPEEKPVRVVVQAEKPITWTWPSALGPVLEVIATSFLVIVLVIFMLLRRRELRNRIILFVGSKQMSTTTRALDEAAERISRYLLMQTIINTTFGFCIGVGLYFIGLPYALLWGFLAGLLRFIPYIGPWLGSSLPVILSLGVFPGWLHPLLVAGLFVALEVAINTTMEPLIYGNTAGVSEVALLVSVAFWTWVWGPIGLALATPLTVCMVVLGKYVPALEFIPLLMGDDPGIEPDVLLYQRILAGDKREAREIVEKYSRKHTLTQVYDRLLLPVLSAAKRDQKMGKLSDENKAFLAENVAELTTKSLKWVKRNVVTESAKRKLVFGAPAQGIFDEIALKMLQNLLAPRLDLEILSSEALSGEMMKEAERRRPALIIVAAVSPTGETESHYLCKRFQNYFGDSLKVIAGQFGSPPAPSGDHPRLAEADAAANSLAEAKSQILQFAELETEEEQAGRVSAGNPSPGQWEGPARN